MSKTLTSSKTMKLANSAEKSYIKSNHSAIIVGVWVTSSLVHEQDHTSPTIALEVNIWRPLAPVWTHW